MDLVGSGILLALLLLASRRRGAIGGRVAQQAATRRFAGRVGLPVTDPPDPHLVRRVVRRYRYAMAGAAAGLLAPGLLPLADALDTYGWPAALLLGLAGGAVLAQVTEPRPAPDAVRVAHAVAPVLTDYVPRWAVGLILAGVAAVAGLTAVALAAPMPASTPGGPGLDAPGVLGVGAGAVLLSAAALWAARTVVRRRRSVTSAAELAVDDALRGQAVRDCLGLSAATSLGALLVLGLYVDNSAGLSRVLHGWSSIVGLVVAVVALTAHEATGGPRRWRSRLHPGLAAS